MFQASVLAAREGAEEGERLGEGPAVRLPEKLPVVEAVTLAEAEKEAVFEAVAEMERVGEGVIEAESLTDLVAEREAERDFEIETEDAKL